MRSERRWVLYKGEAEASKVPPEWHAWLHYTTDKVPDPKRRRRPWEKPHQPNLSGTAQAYRPPGHVLQGGRRARGTGDYEPWTPAA
jgi:NADH:ubiquinone oxidoreductase subunit